MTSSGVFSWNLSLLLLLLCLLSFALILFVGQGYNANYGTADVGYAGNPYPGIYGMNPVSIVASQMWTRSYNNAKRSVFSTFCILTLRITLNFKRMVLLGDRTTEGNGKNS